MTLFKLPTTVLVMVCEYLDERTLLDQTFLCKFFSIYTRAERSLRYRVKCMAKLDSFFEDKRKHQRDLGKSDLDVVKFQEKLCEEEKTLVSKKRAREEYRF